MEGVIVVIVAAGLYFGWLWNNRGANEYRQALAEINFRERVKRRKALRRRIPMGRIANLKPRRVSIRTACAQLEPKGDVRNVVALPE